MTLKRLIAETTRPIRVRPAPRKNLKVCAYCMTEVTERLKNNVCKRCASAGIEA